MKQCLKILISGKVQGVSYRKFVQKHAQKFEIEGTIQNLEDKKSVMVYACGSSSDLDKFIDYLYQGTPESDIQDVRAEPFLQEKDFRGVFRIIEN